MSIESDLADLKRMIIMDKTIKFQCKIQKFGKDGQGRPRYMIYATQIVNKLGFKPGDKIEFFCQKIEDANVKTRNYHPNFKKNWKSKTVDQKIAEAQEKKSEMVTELFTLAEQEFIKKYRESKDSATLIDFLDTNAKLQFGEERSKILIQKAKTEAN